MVLWDGACTVHESFCRDKIQHLKQLNPGAKFIAHPESEEAVLEMADFIGSTSALLDYARKSDVKTIIVATEAGILHQMTAENPNKKLIAAPIEKDNTCACSECDFMKMNTMQKLYRCLKNETNEVVIPPDTASRALVPILRMLSISQTRKN
jgi:quinolinate synthase